MIIGKITGISQVLKNVQTQDLELVKRASTAIHMVGLFVQRESQLLVPIDTSALKNSAYSRSWGQTSTTPASVTVGYTMSYAVYVHEDLEARHAPGKTAKYLERVPKERYAEMTEIFRSHATLP